jgi:hypothetical protein
MASGIVRLFVSVVILGAVTVRGGRRRRNKRDANNTSCQSGKLGA